MLEGDNEDRLRTLNLPSCVYRIRRMDMIQTMSLLIYFRSMKSIDDLEASNFVTMNTVQNP